MSEVIRRIFRMMGKGIPECSVGKISEQLGVVDCGLANLYHNSSTPYREKSESDVIIGTFSTSA